MNKRRILFFSLQHFVFNISTINQDDSGKFFLFYCFSNQAADNYDGYEHYIDGNAQSKRFSFEYNSKYPKC